MRLHMVDSGRGIVGPKRIFLVRYRLKMIRVHARLIAAKMINSKTVWNATLKVSVDQSMSQI